jgi:hypothetical protein
MAARSHPIFLTANNTFWPSSRTAEHDQEGD